jgi:glc operon protein GlcG
VGTDLPSYLVHERAGSRRTSEVASCWREDLTPIAIGCWFGAEAALSAAGVRRMRHIELGVQGPLFRTSRRAQTAGGFNGPRVVSMRRFANSDVDKVVEITSRLPRSHGAPLHRGEARELGIVDMDEPDWGEPLRPTSEETALFWGCGPHGAGGVASGKAAFLHKPRAGRNAPDRFARGDGALTLIRPALKLSHAGALAVLNAAVEAAQAMGVPQCIAVVDEGCNLLAFVRMDGSRVLSIESATHKAMTAAATGLPTGRLSPDRAPALAAATSGRLTNLLGGLPLVVEGQVVGGIGVGSGTGEQDVEVAKAAVAAFEIDVLGSKR